MSSLKVIRASAGSGKTYNLTHEYLHLILTENDAYKHILAVTFTNKATQEMKSRIIEELFILSDNKPSKQLDQLIKSTGFTENQIRNKAIIILKKILHNYSMFSVNTIDTFFQKIIRSFTRELGIQDGYLIELDTKLVLEEIIKKLILKAESDSTLLNWLTSFAESLIEKGENWDLKRGIFDLGEEIFKEEFKTIDESSLKLISDRELLRKYRAELFSIIKKIEHTFKSYGNKAIQILNDHDLYVDDFSNKSKGPAGFLIKLSNNPFKEPGISILNALESPEKWYVAGSGKKTEIKQVAENFLIPLLKEVVQYYNDNYMVYYTAATILKNIYTLGILIDLSNLSSEWCSDNNTFLLSESQSFLNKIIGNNDTPFIYEKAGVWYHHFMIDEFQDTSILQWSNFKPLISNSLSNNFDNLTVGDTKQSIYRWRNSSWEILESRINIDFPGIVKEITLKMNWRSQKVVIDFNNNFFTRASQILQENFIASLKECDSEHLISEFPSFTEIYKNLDQIPGNSANIGGFVSLHYIKANNVSDYYDLANQKLIEKIYDLLDHGYHLSDIALLTRKNSEAKLLADFLLKKANENDNKPRINVISDEALRLGNSIVVTSVISFLNYLVAPDDTINNYYIESIINNYFTEDNDKGEWIQSNSIKAGITGSLSFYLPKEFLHISDSRQSYSLIEITEKIIAIFDLLRFKGEYVYLMAFRDLVIEFTQKYGSDIIKFIEFWKETGKEYSISAPSGQDAVRILTTHKAKGLEFKITIIPYCTWELNSFNQTYLWVKPEIQPFNTIPVLPLSYTKVLQKTFFAKEYFRENYLQMVDNINLLYVAFTRSQQGLYIFCRNDEKDNLNTVSDLVRRVLGESDISMGSLIDNSNANKDIGNKYISYNSHSDSEVSKRIKVASQGKLFIDPVAKKPSRPVSEGKILHEIFSFIRRREDIETATKRLYLQGKIIYSEQEKYKRIIEDAMNDIQVSTWFTGNWQLITEADIIKPGGDIKRPDRIMIKGNDTIIIDYKFGEKVEPHYEKQIKEYVLLLKEMGYVNIEAYIWYVRLKRVVNCRIKE